MTAPLDFVCLDGIEFDEFCFELLGALGFFNIDWVHGRRAWGQRVGRKIRDHKMWGGHTQGCRP